MTWSVTWISSCILGLIHRYRNRWTDTCINDYNPRWIDRCHLLTPFLVRTNLPYPGELKTRISAKDPLCLPRFLVVVVWGCVCVTVQSFVLCPCTHRAGWCHCWDLTVKDLETWACNGFFQVTIVSDHSETWTQDSWLQSFFWLRPHSQKTPLVKI